MDQASEGDSDVAPVYCPIFQHVMELLGRRWSGVILRELLHGTDRFSDLRRAIPGLTDRLLADRLDEFEAEGLLTRDFQEAGIPIYRLTLRGLDLRQTITAVETHAEQWADSCHLATRPGRRVCL